MKKLIRVTTIACLLATTYSASAAPNASVRVHGTVSKGACIPTISQGGLVSLGEVSTNSLSTTDDNQLPVNYLSLQITCTGNTLLSWTTTDNRASTVNLSTHVLESGVNNADIHDNNNLFGIGTTSNGQHIGAWTGAFDYTQLTTNISDPVLINQDFDLGVDGPWMLTKSGLFADGIDTRRQFSLGKAGDPTIPVPFTTVTIPMKINSAINKGTSQTIKNTESIDGNATISLIYL